MNLFTLPFTLIGTVLACCTDILQHLHNPKACRSTRGSTTGSRANLRASRRRRQPSIGSRANVTGGCWQVHLTHNVHVYNVRLCHFHAGTGNHQLVPTPCKLCTHIYIYIYLQYGMRLQPYFLQNCWVSIPVMLRQESPREPSSGVQHTEWVRW